MKNIIERVNLLLFIIYSHHSSDPRNKRPVIRQVFYSPILFTVY
uniref:Uncharacterized protein n=1 Tax=Siphoviridae sp. ctL0q1 TaxID=2825449 RepID=A0A8S5PIN1_9CAUD|nr:MAG TPA: hypothetical protein [Siphoviridae sp. ctL0q1]